MFVCIANEVCYPIVCDRNSTVIQSPKSKTNLDISLNNNPGSHDHLFGWIEDKETQLQSLLTTFEERANWACGKIL